MKKLDNSNVDLAGPFVKKDKGLILDKNGEK